MAQLRRARRMLAASLVVAAFARGAAGQSAARAVDAANAPAEAEQAFKGGKVRVLLSLAEGCGERERFFSQLNERLGSGWEAAPGELARTIDVNVSFTGGRHIARIELTDARGQQVARAVAGAQCEPVLEAIALITVLAIQAQIDELISRSEPSESAAASSARPLDSSATHPTTREMAAAPAEQPAGRTARSPIRPKLRMGGRAGIQWGAGPELASIFGAFAALAWDRWVLGLTFDVGRTGRVRAQGVPAEFELLAGRFEACGRFQPTRQPLTFEPCLFAQGGSLTAQAARELPEVTQGSRGSTSWLVPGVLLGLRGELGPVLLGLETSAGISLDQEHFYLELEPSGRRDVYQVPWLTAGVVLAAGITF